MSIFIFISYLRTIEN